MADGTSVGAVYLDFVVRDTIAQQVQAMAQKAKAQMQQSMENVEKVMADSMARAASKAADSVTQAVEKVSSEAADCGQQVQEALSAPFNKAVALAQVRVKELETKLSRVTDNLQEAKASDNDSAVKSLLNQQVTLCDQLEAARDRLAIQVQAAAQKQAAAEQAAYAKIERAAEAASVRQQEAAAQAQADASPTATASASTGVTDLFRSIRESSEADMAAAEAALRKLPETIKISWQKAIGSIKGLIYGLLTPVRVVKSAVNTLLKPIRAINRAINTILKPVRKISGTVVKMGKSLLGGISSITKGFGGAGKAASGFGSRLKSIVSGALIFNGISAALRNVTSYISNAVSSTDQMRAALANLKGAAATAAAPIIQVLTPALAALANAAATVFSYLSRLVSFFTGKSVSAMASAAKSAASAAGGAAKETEKALRSLAGFDEIETLTTKEEDSSGGGGGSTPELNYDFQGESPFLGSILEAVKAGQWSQVGELVAQKLNESLAVIPWPSIQEKAQAWAQGIVDTLNGFVGGLNWGLVGSTLGNGINTALSFIDTLFQGFDWAKLGSGLCTGLSSLFETIDWETLGRILTDKLKAALDTLHGFLQTFDFSSLGTDLASMTMAAINNVDWVQAAKDLGQAAIGLLNTLNEWITGIDWQQIGNTIADAVAAVDWAGLVSSLVKGIGAACAGLAELIWGIIEDAWTDFVDWWEETAYEDGQFTIEGLLQGIMDALSNIWNWIIENVYNPFIEGFCNAFDIHSPSRVMADLGTLLVEGLLGGISKAWESITAFFSNVLNSLKSAFSSAWNSIKSNATTVWNAISTTASNVWNGIKSTVLNAVNGIKSGISAAFTSVKTTITSIWNSIVSAIKGAINGIIGAINGMISGIVGGLNSVISAMNKLKFTIPDWVPVMGGKSFGFSIASISAPQIPMLANGGAIRQPTLAMMGEYTGARSDPEIAAPQSFIQEAVANAMQDLAGSNLQGFEAVVAVLREILEAVLGIEVSDTMIGQAAERYRQKQAVITGGYF